MRVFSSSGSPQGRAQGFGQQELDERVMNLCVYNHSAIRRAALAGHVEGARGQLQGRVGEVGVVPDDRRVVSTELGLQRDPPQRAGLLGAENPRPTNR